MLDVRHFFKFSTSAEKPTIPYTSEFTGSYGYFEYEFRVDQFFESLYDRMKPFKVNRSG